MEPEVQFVGLKVSSGKSSAVVADYDEDCYETVHLTQVALGDKPAKGPHTVFVENDGEKFAIGTLDKDKCPHFSIDITMATDTIAFSHSGESDVFVTGYRTVSIKGYDDDSYADLYGSGEEFSDEEMESDDEDDSGREDEEEEEESSEDEQAPRGVPLLNGNGKYRALLEDETEDGSEDEESEEGGSEVEDSEEEEEEEERPAQRKSLGAGAKANLQQAVAAFNAKKQRGGPAVEEAVDAPLPAKGAAKEAPAKRKQPQQPQQQSKTPQPAKKPRTEDVKQPASAPAKAAGGAAAAGEAKEYEAALRTFLQRNGPSNLNALGGKVKRPAAVPKLKAFVEQHSQVFKFDPATQTVSLK